MKLLKIIVFVSCATIGSCSRVSAKLADNPNDQYCLDDVRGNCGNKDNEIACNSIFGQFEELEAQWSQLANDNLAKNFEYLKLYIHFSSYLMQRPGFAALFRALADYKWELSQNTISFITERGGTMDFCQPCVCSASTCEADSCECDDSCSYCSVEHERYHREVIEVDGVEGNPDGYEIGELPSLALAIDNEKRTCLIADEIHRIAVGSDTHDVQSAYYSVLDYLRPHRKILRNLVAYENELAQMLTQSDQMVSLYKMDDYIKACDVFD